MTAKTALENRCVLATARSIREAWPERALWSEADTANPRRIGAACQWALDAMMRTTLLFAVTVVALTGAQNVNKKRVVRCFWGKCGIFHGAWKKCAPNEQCDGSELHCERQCILEHTGCPPKHTAGSCRRDLLLWKCSPEYSCSQKRDSARCHRTCLPHNSNYNDPKNILSLLPIVGPFFQ